MYSQTIFYKNVKTNQWRRDNLFNKWFWKNQISTCKRMKLDPYLTPCTNINSKQIHDLNIQPKIIKLLEENTGQKLHNIASDILDMTPKAKTIKGKEETSWTPTKL